MSDCSCDHSHDEERPDEVQQVLDAVHAVIQSVPNEDLVYIFRAAVSEMFIRTHPDDDWNEEWAGFSEEVHNMFDPEMTELPEILAGYQEHREEFAENVDKAKPKTSSMTEEQGMFELNAILGEQGVLDDDTAYGNYL